MLCDLKSGVQFIWDKKIPLQTSTQISPKLIIQPILGHSPKYVKRLLKPGIVRIFALVHWVCTPLSCQSKNANIHIFWLNRSIGLKYLNLRKFIILCSHKNKVYNSCKVLHGIYFWAILWIHKIITIDIFWTKNGNLTSIFLLCSYWSGFRLLL